MKDIDIIAKIRNLSKIRNKANFKLVIGLIVIALLIIMEVIVCVQFATGSLQGFRKFVFIALLICCFILDTCCVIEVYVPLSLGGKIAVLCVDFVLLLAIGLMTSSVYLSALFCIVLTQAYSGLTRFRDNLIVFCVSVVVFTISYVCGWYLNYNGFDIHNAAVSIVSDVVLGMLILAAHFIVANFLLQFYRNNQRLIQALQEAEESREQLKEVYEQLSQSAVYEERNRIAGDIHDNAGHSMTTVIMQTEAAKKLIDTNPEEAKKAIISANIQAKNALEQMRESVHLLAGREGSNSVKTLVGEIIAQTIDGTDIKVRSDVDDFELDEAQLRFVGTSLKEALANGMRHGGATAFYIEVKSGAADFTVLVSDNGSGLGVNFKEGFGLRQMRLKAEVLGGKMEISGEDGEGCELVLTLPLKKQI